LVFFIRYIYEKQIAFLKTLCYNFKGNVLMLRGINPGNIKDTRLVSALKRICDSDPIPSETIRTMKNGFLIPVRQLMPV